MISVIILTKNEEKNIKACMQSLLWCDEIIIIDDHSEDNTVEIAKKAGATVYFHDLNNDFSSQRNFGLEKAHGDWILFIDADERVDAKLQKEIVRAISSRRNRYNGYFLKRKDFLWGRPLLHGESSDISLLRLARNESMKWNGTVHETWQAHGHIGMLRSPLYHYPHQSVREFLSEINFYTDLRAGELYKQKITSNTFSILFYTIGKFVRNYFFLLGILDGIPGLLSALMMSFHSFLVRSKLWMLWQKPLPQAQEEA